VNESRAYIIMSIKGQTRGVSGVDRMCGETCVFGRVVLYGKGNEMIYESGHIYANIRKLNRL